MQIIIFTLTHSSLYGFDETGIQIIKRHTVCFFPKKSNKFITTQFILVHT